MLNRFSFAVNGKVLKVGEFGEVFNFKEDYIAKNKGTYEWCSFGPEGHDGAGKPLKKEINPILLGDLIEM